MEMVFILPMAGAAAYLLYMIGRQYYEATRRKARIRAAETAWQAATQSTAAAKARLLQVIAAFYGEEDAQRVSERDMWIGMTDDLLRASWGEAEEAENSYTGGARSQKWYYGAHTNKWNLVRYKYEVQLENDVVTGWKDLV